MSESPAEVSNKKNLRRRHSSSPALVKPSKSMSKSRSPVKRTSRSTSYSSSNKSRSRSVHKTEKDNKRKSTSRTRRRYSRSRSYRSDRKSRKYYSRSRSAPRFTKYSRMKNENAEPCTCIGVFGLSKKTVEETLWDKFEKYGKIDNVRLIMDRIKRESLGYAFIDYKEIDSAIRAMKEAHGMDIDGNNIRLDYSVGKKPATNRFYKDRTSPYNRYENKYRNNGHREQRRRSRSPSSRGSYRRRKESRRRRSSRSPSRGRRSRSSRASYKKRRDSRSRNSHGSRSSHRRRRRTSHSSNSSR